MLSTVRPSGAVNRLQSSQPDSCTRVLLRPFVQMYILPQEYLRSGMHKKQIGG